MQEWLRPTRTPRKAGQVGRWKEGVKCRPRTDLAFTPEGAGGSTPALVICRDSHLSLSVFVRKERGAVRRAPELRFIVQA